MVTASMANRTIPRPTKGVERKAARFNLKDIADLCRYSVKKHHKAMREFAKLLPNNLEGLRMLFDFVDRNFEYVQDPVLDAGGVQAIQSPQVLWHQTKNGDCKSYTGFIACTVLNMGFPVILRLVDYGDPIEKHIYPVAILNKKEVPLDVVWKKQQGGPFGREKMQNMRKIKDMVVQPGLYTVGNANAGTQSVSYQDIYNEVGRMEAALADIPDEIIAAGPGDVTKMTGGQLDRYLMVDRFQEFARQANDPVLKQSYLQGIEVLRKGSFTGIGNIQSANIAQDLKAFMQKAAKDKSKVVQPFKLGIPVPKNANQEVNIQGIGKIRIGKFFKKIGKKIGGLLRKLVNWVFKGAAKKAGPFFLFLFLSNKGKSHPKLRKRVAAQQKALSVMAKKLKVKESKLLSSFNSGVKKYMGGSPEQVINYYSKSEIGAAAAAIPAAVKASGVLLQAVKVLIKIFNKIGNVFKKKSKRDELPPMNEADGSDVRLLEEIAAEKLAEAENFDNPIRKPDKEPSSSGGGAALGLGLLGLLAMAQ